MTKKQTRNAEKMDTQFSEKQARNRKWAPGFRWTDLRNLKKPRKQKQQNSRKHLGVEPKESEMEGF